MKMLCFLLLSSLHLVVSVPLSDFYSTDSSVTLGSGALVNYLETIQLTCGDPSQFRVRTVALAVTISNASMKDVIIISFSIGP